LICGNLGAKEPTQLMVRIRRVNGCSGLWKNGRKPEETQQNHGK